MPPEQLSDDNIQNFMFFFNAVKEPICVTDLQGNIIKSNNSWNHTFCPTGDQDLNNLTSILHPDDRQTLVNSLLDLTEKKNIKIECLSYLKNCKYQPFEWQLNSKNEFAYIIAFEKTVSSFNSKEFIAQRIIRKEGSFAIRLTLKKNQGFDRFTDDLLSDNIKNIIKGLKINAGYLYILDEETNVFSLLEFSVYAESQEVVHNVINHFDHNFTGILGETIRSGKSIIVNEVQDAFISVLLNENIENQLFNFITVPVFKDETVAALFVFINKKRWFTETDLAYIIENLGNACEVIEHKFIHEELVKMQNRFQRAEIQTNIGYWEYNLVTRNGWLSSQMYKLLGFDPGKGVPTIEEFLEHIYPEDRPAVSELLNHLPTGQDLNTPEFRSNPQYAPFRYFSTFCETEKDWSDRPKVIFGTIQDITKRKLAQLSLKSSEARALALLNAIPDMIFRLREDGVFIDYIADEKNLLVEPEHFLGKNFVEIFPSDLAEIIKSNLDKTIKTKELQCFEYEIKNTSLGEREYEARMVSSGSDEIIAIIRDITERKKIERELKEKEESLSMTLQSIGDGVIVVDLKARVIKMNTVAEEITGWTLNEAYFKPLDKVFPLIDGLTLNSIPSPVNEVFEKNQIVGLVNDTILISKSGREYHITDSAAPIHDKNGNILGTILVFSDITEKYNIEKKIRERERQLSTIISFLPGMVYRCECDHFWTMEYVSKASLALTGYTPEELVNNKMVSFEDLIDPEYRESIRGTWYEILEQKKVFVFEYTIKTKDGIKKWVLEKAHGIYSESDELLTIEGIIEDITDRKSNELNIEESRSRYQELFLNNPIPMWIFNADNYAFIEVNDAAVKKYGYSREEFAGMTTKDIRPPEDVPLMIEFLKQNDFSFRTNRNLRHRKKDGTIFPVEIASHLLPEANGVRMRLVIASDITDRIKEEDQLLEAKLKAEENDRLKTAFLANMSHEIRTPMSGILGFAELLKDTNLDLDIQKEYISVIEQSGQRMLNIINDIIDISKIEAGKMVLKLEDVDINGLMFHLYTFFKPEAEKKGLKLSFVKKLADEESIVTTDRTKLSQIISNLLKNAIKFTYEGEIVYGCERIDGNLKFFIKDTGVGVPEDQRDKIFNRFVQSSKTIALNQEGAGLGLAIAKSFVNLLGGNIWIKPNNGKGSVFYFEIPFKKQSVSNHTAENNLLLGNNLDKRRFLIVDDDENSQLLLKRLFEKFKVNLLFTENGHDAVEIIKSEVPIDLIIMDIKMPVMDGLEATRQIKKINNKVPVIALTAYALTGDDVLALNVGCNDYLTKPVNKEALFQAINNQLKKHSV
jgi:PAS domain S-box-containing protein